VGGRERGSAQGTTRSLKKKNRGRGSFYKFISKRRPISWKKKRGTDTCGKKPHEEKRKKRKRMGGSLPCKLLRRVPLPPIAEDASLIA